MALSCIDDEKAPGIDSFNSYFFKKIWNIIKYKVYAVVRDFFDFGTLHDEVN